MRPAISGCGVDHVTMMSMMPSTICLRSTVEPAMYGYMSSAIGCCVRAASMCASVCTVRPQFRGPAHL